MHYYKLVFKITFIGIRFNKCRTIYLEIYIKLCPKAAMVAKFFSS